MLTIYFNQEYSGILNTAEEKRKILATMQFK